MIEKYLGIGMWVVMFACGAAAASQVQMYRYERQLSDMRESVTAARNAAIENARMFESARADKLALAEALEHERNKAADIVERVITEEVVRYVQTPGAHSGGVNVDGVRLINAAAGGRMSEAGESPRPLDGITSAPRAAARSRCDLRRGGLIGHAELWEVSAVCEPAYLLAGVDKSGDRVWRPGD